MSLITPTEDEIRCQITAPDGCVVATYQYEFEEGLTVYRQEDHEAKSSCLVRGRFEAIKPSGDGGVIALVRDGPITYVLTLPPPTNPNKTDYIPTTQPNQGD